ncbi:MAG: hypothetical protein DMG24_15375 [Acidobacteria bacterium]|nr:MAG: hypothetical protein DMG24_15375 [Acidobacteriota bacterium]
MVSGQKMCRRLLDELERDPSAVGQLQRVQKAVVAIFEILIGDFELAFELDPLVCGGAVLGGCRSRGQGP